MKKIHLLLSAFLLIASRSHAQNPDLNNFIAKHKSESGMTFAYLSKDLFDVVSNTNVKDQDWKKLQSVVKNIGSLTILVGDSIKNSVPLYKEARHLVPEPEFDQILSVRDGNENVGIWSKDDGSVVTDVVLLVGSPDEFVLICFSGSLELGNITELANLFNAASAEEIAKTTEAVSIDFTVYPNPSSGEITFTCTDTQEQPAVLTITDMNGKLKATQKLSGANSQRVILGELPAGNYWVQLKTAKGSVGVKQLQIVK